MRRILGVVSGVALLVPLTVQAQARTPEQKELWSWEVACLETVELDVKRACFHDDFIGWGAGAAEPTGMTARLDAFAAFLEGNELVSFDARPLAITVKGNTGVLIYEATAVTKDKATGEEAKSVIQWTDVAVREGGRWTWIADHGTMAGEG